MSATLIGIDDWRSILLCHCMLPVLDLFKIGFEVSIIPGRMFFNQPNFAESNNTRRSEVNRIFAAGGRSAEQLRVTFYQSSPGTYRGFFAASAARRSATKATSDRNRPRITGCLHQNGSGLSG